MILEFQHNFESYTDRELVELVTQPPKNKRPNEEGVAFLLYKRYDPLLHKLYVEIYGKQHDLYGDCLNDLFSYLKRGEPVWRKLINLEWRSSFGTWLGVTARHRFVEIKPYLIGKSPDSLSIDGDAPTSLSTGKKKNSYSCQTMVSRCMRIRNERLSSWNPFLCSQTKIRNLS